ncbi:outer membrane protein transport protein [Vibrio kyushuensis]|uniref:OmpP1/FadL family transporter n=1 Tax=Vibrio kyushuensis TaxID=2910249 RepID=UPI003D10F11D
MSPTLQSKTRHATPIFALSLLGAAMFSATAANASGFFMQEAVVANAGTAGAGDGVYTQSAAAMWANPATMSHMGESKTTVNTLLLDLEMEYTDRNDNGDAKGHTIMPSVGLFHATELEENLHLGLALGVVGGSSISYGQEWAGANALDEVTLTVIQFNPSLAFKIDDQWSMGAGAMLNWVSLEQTTALISPEQDTDRAVGFNFGVMYKHSNSWSVGASYRSKIEHNFSLDIPREGPLSPSIATDISVPEIIDVSGQLSLTQELDLLATVQYHRWSRMDNTAMDFGAGTGLLDIERQWSDTWKFAVGADYQLNTDWRLKAGFSYETSPQDDPSMQWVDLPVGEQYRYTLGASTNWGDTGVDFFYEYADLGSVEMDRNHPLIGAGGVNGTFDGRMHFVGVNFTF